MIQYGKIAVIGAGPAGLLTSLFIRNNDAYIFEEHKQVGVPEHCTGLIGVETASFFTKILGWKIIDNVFYSIFFHTPIGVFKLYFRKPIAYHIKRPLLEEKLLDKVYGLGHVVYFGVRVKPGVKLGGFRAGDRSFLVDKIIASDGASSVFRLRYFGKIKNYIYGVQRLIRTSNVDPHVFHVLYNNYTPKFFQWFVPLDYDIALIGYGTTKHMVDPEKIFYKIISKVGVSAGSTIKTFGGLIPFDKPLSKPGFKNKIFFVGDSIPLTKTYTGGGLHGISIYAPVLGKSVDEDNIKELSNYYSFIRRDFVLEYYLSKLSRTIGYWIPSVIVSKIHEVGLLSEIDYDKHMRLLFKTLIVSPLLFSEIITFRKK